MPKFPDVEVQLTGEDGNAFFIMSRVRKAMERAGYREEAKAYFDAGFESPSYDDLLRLTMETVSVA